MNFLFEKPESVIVAGVNWPTLDYLIERFNRSGLEGFIVLRRTPFQKDLQLCLTAECNGKTLSLQSETFEDSLLTENEEREQLIRVVSRFLLRAKHQHAVLVASPASTASSHLGDILGKGPFLSKARQDLPSNGNVTGENNFHRAKGDELGGEEPPSA